MYCAVLHNRFRSEPQKRNPVQVDRLTSTSSRFLSMSQYRVSSSRHRDCRFSIRYEACRITVPALSQVLSCVLFMDKHQKLQRIYTVTLHPCRINFIPSNAPAHSAKTQRIFLRIIHFCDSSHGNPAVSQQLASIRTILEAFCVFKPYQRQIDC